MLRRLNCEVALLFPDDVLLTVLHVSLYSMSHRIDGLKSVILDWSNKTNILRFHNSESVLLPSINQLCD